MAMENTYGNSTTNIAGHMKVLKQEFKIWPRGLGLDRIRALRAALLLSTNVANDPIFCTKISWNK